MDDEWDDCSYYRKPRMQLASEPYGPSDADEADELELRVSKPVLAVFAGGSVALLAVAYLTSGPLQFALIWIALALVVGPLAPVAQTGGDCRVGVGEVLQPADHDDGASADGGGSDDSPSVRRAGDPPAAVTREARSDAPEAQLADLPVQGKGDDKEGAAGAGSGGGSGGQGVDTSEWTRQEMDQLKKLLVKLPRGTPQRWEAIAAALGSGRRAADDVIRSAKAVALQKPSDRDAYGAFLAQRRTSSKAAAAAAAAAARGGAAAAATAAVVPTSRWEVDGTEPDPPAANGTAAAAAAGVGPETDAAAAGGGAGGAVWTDAQDRALLQALKEFPKETALRWERVATAVSAHSKQQCFKRFTELRENFRKKGGDVPDS